MLSKSAAVLISLETVITLTTNVADAALDTVVAGVEKVIVVLPAAIASIVPSGEIVANSGWLFTVVIALPKAENKVNLVEAPDSSLISVAVKPII